MTQPATDVRTSAPLRALARMDQLLDAGPIVATVGVDGDTLTIRTAPRGGLVGRLADGYLVIESWCARCGASGCIHTAALVAVRPGAESTAQRRVGSDSRSAPDRSAAASPRCTPFSYAMAGGHDAARHGQEEAGA